MRFTGRNASATIDESALVVPVPGTRPEGGCDGRREDDDGEKGMSVVFVPFSWNDIKANAVRFNVDFGGMTDERQQGNIWVRGFLDVFRPDMKRFLANPEVRDAPATFEYPVKRTDASKGFIDFLWKSKLIVEMKSAGKDLGEAMHQLDGYVAVLPPADIPPLYMVSDFRRIHLVRKQSDGGMDVLDFMTSDLRDFVRYFAEIAGYDPVPGVTDPDGVITVGNVASIGTAYALYAHGNQFAGETEEVREERLAKFLLRVAFCCFAEDAGVFEKDVFSGYVNVQNRDGQEFNERLRTLFRWLSMPEDRRAEQLSPPSDLRPFPYVGGELFRDDFEIPHDWSAYRKVIDLARLDWKDISPSVLGSMFQSVRSRAERRLNGEHYTSEANILKALGPLFLDDLRAEFERVKVDAERLAAFHDRLTRIHVLDPACGSGNFLIVAYQRLRLLELDVLRMELDDGYVEGRDVSRLCRIRLSQFHGIELDSFACEVARAGMWMAAHQLDVRTAELFGKAFLRLPLDDDAAHIVHGNALRMDWNDVVPAGRLTYVVGNPPFLGARMMGAGQKADLMDIFENAKGAGDLDYVTCWFRKTSDMMTANPGIRAALVATNSITQGTQASLLWKPLFGDGVHIDFARRTFKWENEARGQAAVHCVIVGFYKAEAFLPRTASSTTATGRPSPGTSTPISSMALTSSWRAGHILSATSPKSASEVNPSTTAITSSPKRKRRSSLEGNPTQRRSSVRGWGRTNS